MCGIVGYTGFRPAKKILINSLKRLEYRGYDSAGIALLDRKNISIFKKAGKLEILEKNIENKKLDGTTGIGHTRWATHGAPNNKNAHPHFDCRKELALVHNGIIENYESLRFELEKSGHKFKSNTDTEVLVHLIERYYNKDLLSAVKKTLKKIKGTYALVVMSKEKDLLICARKDSPLLIGLNEKEKFIASDAPALLPYTRSAYILEDNEIAKITPENVQVFVNNKIVKKEVFKISGEIGAIKKEGYRHFMLKEIMEQPRAIRDTLSERIDSREKQIYLKEINLSTKRIKALKRIHIIACGTSAHAAWVAKGLIERFLRLNSKVSLASEFRYEDPLINSDDLIIVISQSGETADTLAALRLARKKKSHILAITNVIGSSVAREADDVIFTRAGPEIAVASTKAYTSQLVVLCLLIIYFGRIRGSISGQQEGKMVKSLIDLPQKIEELLKEENCLKLKKYAREIAKQDHVFFIGRGLDYISVMEGALKLKEISYIHAEAYPAGELKHGTLALITKNTPVVALITQKSVREKTINNIKEVEARDGKLYIITDKMDNIKQLSNRLFLLPREIDLLLPILSIVPMQLIAYYAAEQRKCAIDKPRNLAKSVTVE